MTKIVKLFSFVCLLLFSSVFALSDNPILVAKPKVDLEKYRLYVTKVDPEFHCFALSNKIVFSVLQKNWETETLPEVGTEVTILPKPRHPDNRHSLTEEGEFYAEYTKDAKTNWIAVWMTKDSEQDLLTYDSSESVCTQPGLIYGCWADEEVIELSDGSKWIFKKTCNCSKEVASLGFNPGDRLIITRLDENFCILTDIDRSFFYGGKTVTEKTTAIYRWEVVKPYIPEMTTKE